MRPSFTKFAVYGEYKRPWLQGEVISFIRPNAIAGKKKNLTSYQAYEPFLKAEAGAM